MTAFLDHIPALFMPGLSPVPSEGNTASFMRRQPEVLKLLALPGISGILAAYHMHKLVHASIAPCFLNSRLLLESVCA